MSTTNVTAVLAELTTQRDRFQAAITALKAIAVREAAATIVRPTAPRRARRGMFRVDEWTRLQIVNAMRGLPTGRGAKAQAIRSLSRQYGVRATTIASGWERWAAEFAAKADANGNGHTDTAPVELVL